MSIIYCEQHDRKWDSDTVMECPLCEHTVDLVERLRDLAIAYPPHIFGLVTEQEIKEHSSLITRNSAAVMRHFGPIFTAAADEIERLRDEAPLTPYGDSLVAALQRIAYEPIGESTASHAKVLDDVVEIARAALDPLPEVEPGPMERTMPRGWRTGVHACHNDQGGPDCQICGGTFRGPELK